ncbi:phenylacetyl-CoA ligase [Favolaschia claudopus]|uniref:Phenylacetyl-CoA ligase n=1 Tax=Favolaschia claudopus TaxID=2862362 RepID=A0AAW0C2W6_9AGAR
MTVYQSLVGNFALPSESLTIPEFMLDATYPGTTGKHDNADWICLVDDASGRYLRFSELRSRTAYLCAALHELQNIKNGDMVALISHNDIDYPVCVWAVHRLGATVAPMSPAMTADELAYLLKLADPSVIIAQAGSSELARNAAKRAGMTEYSMVIMDSDPDQSLGYPTTESLIVCGKSLPPFRQKPLAPGEAKSKLAFLTFSSGTTGMPKAVCISHYNVISNVLQAEALNHVYDPQLQWSEKRYRPGGVCSGVLPLYHIYGLVVNLHFVIYARMKLVISAKFDFEKMLDNISRYQITNLLIVPPQALLFCKHPAVRRYDLTSVRACMIAAAPISAELTQSFLRVLPGIHLGQGYGMSETCAAISMYPIHPKVGVQGSGGKLIPGTIAKVVRADGTLAPPGERGELYVRGPQVTSGYYKNPAATKESLIEGWLRTGDEVYFDTEDNLFIVDRVKELIKVKGHQVAPAELEGHLLDHEDVADVAVIGVPDDFAGELPYAFIVLKPQPASQVRSDPQSHQTLQKSIFKHVSSAKSSYKWLNGGIEFVDSIPKSASGKILRRVLRERVRSVNHTKL